MEWADVIQIIGDILSTTLFKMKETPVTVSNVVLFVLFTVGFIMFGKAARRILYNRFLSKFEIDRGKRYTMSQITQYLIVVLGILFSLQLIGLSLSSLAVVFGLLSVGIGFGLQNLTSNFVSGLILLFEQPISVGDRVMVNETEGDVYEINIRATKIRTLNNIIIIVPNSDLVSKEVINYSHGDTTFRLDIEVGVSYQSDLDLVIETLTEIAEKNQYVLDTPRPEAHLIEFGDSSWNMELRAWIGKVDKYPMIRNQLNCEIIREFRERGIKIPYPQRDLHVRSPLPLPHRSSGEEKKAS